MIVPFVGIRDFGSLDGRSEDARRRHGRAKYQSLQSIHFLMFTLRDRRHGMKPATHMFTIMPVKGGFFIEIFKLNPAKAAVPLPLIAFFYAIFC